MRTLSATVPKGLKQNIPLIFRGDVAEFCHAILAKIVRCDASVISLMHLSISFNEFQVLTKSGCLKDLSLSNSDILYPDQSKVPLEDLFEFIPNITSI